jgi:hypothetical protein
MKNKFEFAPSNLSPSPAGAVEPKQSVPSKPEKSVAHADPAAAAPAPASHTFVATFAIRNPQTGNIKADVVEVPHTSKPKVDQAAAWKAIRIKHPKVADKDIRRTAGKIVTRPGGLNPSIAVSDGQTIKQLFPDRTEFETGRTIGTVIFEGALCDVILRHLRARASFAVSLRQSGGTVVNFSDQVTTTRLTEDLPSILKEVLGPAAETLKLYLHKA